MRDEREAIMLYRLLTDEGYLIKSGAGDAWEITEPKTYDMPQQRTGLRSIRECMLWADGAKVIRFIAPALRKPKKEKTNG